MPASAYLQALKKHQYFLSAHYSGATKKGYRLYFFQSDIRGVAAAT
jgi:hypothetical protein